MAERIHVVGVGPDGRCATDAEVPTAPELVLATPRLEAAAAVAWPGVAPRPLDLDRLTADLAAVAGPAVVVASGDPGFFGVARRLARVARDTPLQIHPAVSSVAVACARAGVCWDDARVVSAHGRDPHAAVAACLAHPVVAVLTAPDATPADLAAALTAAGAGDRELVVAERLGHEDERVRRLPAAAAGDALAADPAGEPSVVVVLDPAHAARPRATLAPPVDVPDGWALPTGAFAHRDGQVTKPEVRALALAHLAPRTGTVVWDVGAGCGSVAVECARFGAAVVAVDADADQAARCRANAADQDVTVRVVEGRAPEALAGLHPDPDAAFVGGGGAELPAILEALVARVRERIAVALATVERAGPTLAALRTAGWEAHGRLVAVDDLAPLAGGHRLSPHNPVVLVTAKARTS